MYLPTFTITNLILDYVVKYELSVRKIKDTNLPFKIKQEITEKVKADDLQNFSVLIGNPIGYNKALNIIRGKEISHVQSYKSKDQIFANYRSTSEFINNYNSRDYIQPSSELLVHINKIALRNVFEDWETGKYRNFSDKPNELYDNWYRLRDFYPDIKNNVYFDDMFKWIAENQTKLHKLIQVAILLYEFIDKAPLAIGNEITSLYCVGILLKEYQLNPDNIIPIFKSVNFIHEELIEAYKFSKSKKDLTYFIEALLYTMSLQSINISVDIENTFERKVKKKSKISEKFNSRQVKILDYLETNPRITRYEYAMMMGISFMTAFRDLQMLLKEGYLSLGGVGRGTYYFLIRKDNQDGRTKPKVFGSFDEIINDEL